MADHGSHVLEWQIMAHTSLKLPWREAGPPNHHDDNVVSDQWVVNKEVSRWWQIMADAKVHTDGE